MNTKAFELIRFYCEKLNEEQQLNLLDRLFTALTRNITVILIESPIEGKGLIFKAEDKGHNSYIYELLGLMMNDSRALALEVQKELLSRSYFLPIPPQVKEDKKAPTFISGVMIDKMYDNLISAIYTNDPENGERSKLFDRYLAEKISAAIK